MMLGVVTRKERNFWIVLYSITTIVLLLYITLRPAEKKPLPIETWYRIGDVHIDNHPYGADPVVHYDGVVVQDFIGSYHVIAENLKTGIYSEDDSPRFEYKVDRPRIENIQLYDYWAPRLDFPLPKGEWIIQTCWTVHEERGTTKCTRSNVFTIY